MVMTSAAALGEATTSIATHCVRSGRNGDIVPSRDRSRGCEESTMVEACAPGRAVTARYCSHASLGDRKKIWALALREAIEGRSLGHIAVEARGRWSAAGFTEQLATSDVGIFGASGLIAVAGAFGDVGALTGQAVLKAALR